MLFGGDLGRYDRPVLPDPSPDRPRPTCCSSNRPTAIACTSPTTTARALAEIVNETVARGGKVIIPAFAIGPRRGSALLAASSSRSAKAIPVVPVYLDSPMALEALTQYREARATNWTRTSHPAAGPWRRRRTAWRFLHGQAEGRGRGSPNRARCRTRPGHRHLVERHGDRRPRAAPPEGRAARRAEHRALRRVPGGRHARPRCWRRREDQAIHGEIVPVGARIESLDSMSAHADAGEILRWLRRLQPAAAADVPRARRARARWTRSKARIEAGELERGLRVREIDLRIEPETILNLRVRTVRTCSSGSTTRPSSSCYADGFATLPLEQKILVWHLYQAALAGRDIYYDQRYAHGLEMREVLEEILTHATGIDAATLAEIRPLHEALLDQLRSVQQPDGAQVRAAVRAGGVPGRRRHRRTRRARGFRLRPGESLDDLLDAAARRCSSTRRSIRSSPTRRRSGGARHPGGEREQPVRRRHDGRPARDSRSATRSTPGS